MPYSNQVDPTDPILFNQGNKYLPNFTFRGYAQPAPRLDYSTTVSPEAVRNTINRLSADYNTAQNYMDESTDSYYKGLDVAIGDVPDRNLYLRKFDDASKSLVDKFRDKRGSIAYENADFRRESQAMVRQFATDQNLQKLKETKGAYEAWNTLNKAGGNDIIDFNSYFDENGNPYNTLKTGSSFRVDAAKIPNYNTPVTTLWDKVKADTDITEWNNLVTGKSGLESTESNELKIDKLVDGVTANFLQTDEGKLMWRQLTEKHKVGQVWVSPVGEDAAMERIKKHVQDLSGLYKYTNTTNKRGQAVPAEQKEATRRKFTDKSGNEIVEVTMPTGVPLTYTRRGVEFTSDKSVDNYVQKATEDITKIKAEYTKYFTESPDGPHLPKGDVTFEVDENRRPKLTIKNLTQVQQQSLQANIDKANNDLQMKDDNIKYANRFKEEAKKYAGLNNVTPAEQKKYNDLTTKLDSRINEDFRFMGKSRGADGWAEETALLKTAKSIPDEVLTYLKGVYNGEEVPPPSNVPAKDLALYDKAFTKYYGGVHTSLFSTDKEFTLSTKKLEDNEKTLLEIKQEVFKSDPKWSKYFDFFTSHSQEQNAPTYEFSFGANKDGTSQSKDVEEMVVGGVVNGDLPVYKAVGDQSVPLNPDEIKEMYAGDDGKGKEFQVTGWRYDEDDGLVVSARIGKDKQRVEIRNVANLNSYLVNQGYDVQFRLNQVKQLNEGFKNSFGQESLVGWKGIDPLSKEEVDYTYNVQKLLYDEGGFKEGALKVNFDGNVKYYENDAALVAGYVQHMTDKVNAQNKLNIVSDDSGTQILTGKVGDAGKEANNPYGIIKTVDGKSGFVIYGTREEGIKAGQQEIVNKVNGSSDVMVSKYGQDYPERATLQQLIEVFAPAGHGNNDPINYTLDVAAWLGVKPNTLLKDLNPDQVAKMMLRKENLAIFNDIYGQ